MEKIQSYIDSIEAVSSSHDEETQNHLDNLTKPPGSLGKLEDTVKQLIRITGKRPPKLDKKTIFVMAGDHGVAEEGVSAFPAEVTPQMVLNFTQGGAAINVLAKHAGCETKVVDMGVNFDFGEVKNLIDKKVAKGTRNIAKEPAMSEAELEQAIFAGIELAEAEADADIIGTGDMGIANTTPSTALFAHLLSLSPGQITGSGTGLTDDGVAKKVKVIEKVLELHQPISSPLDALMKMGGFEIAGLVGLILGCAKIDIPVVIDGFISTAAAAVAVKAAPQVAGKLFYAHRSQERGHTLVLESLGVEPILDFQMRLGEGTGAALAMPVIEGAVKMYNQMATFDSAGVSGSVD